jgi:hypothetical protein
MKFMQRIAAIVLGQLLGLAFAAGAFWLLWKAFRWILIARGLSQ